MKKLFFILFLFVFACTKATNSLNLTAGAYTKNKVDSTETEYKATYKTFTASTDGVYCAKTIFLIHLEQSSYIINAQGSARSLCQMTQCFAIAYNTFATSSTTNCIKNITLSKNYNYDTEIKQLQSVS